MKLFVLPTEEEDSDVGDDPLGQVWRKVETQSQQDWMQLTIAELCRRMPARTGEKDIQRAKPRL